MTEKFIVFNWCEVDAVTVMIIFSDIKHYTPLSVMHRTQSPFACFSLLDYCNQFCTASYYLIKAGSCRFIVPFVHKEKAYNRQADVMFNQICSFKYFFESTYGSF